MNSIKTSFLIIIAAVLLSGCQSVDHSTKSPASYPIPPVSLNEFFKSPVEGRYSLPESATAPRWLLNDYIIFVSEGDIHLDTLQRNGQITSDKWGVVEFKSNLPSEDTFQQLAAGATEADVVRLIGQPTRNSYDYYPLPFIRLKGGSTKIGTYSWFSVSPSSELTFMKVHTSYEKAKDGRWIINNLTW